MPIKRLIIFIIVSILTTGNIIAEDNVPIQVDKRHEPKQMVVKKKPDIKQYARQGLTESEGNSLNYIITHESSGNPTAKNPHSSASGLFQFLNMTGKTVGCQKTSNPYKQIDCGKRYILKRYGSYKKAEMFGRKNNGY